MFDNTENKKWKKDFFEIFATETNDKQKLEDADKIKIEHFPPVLGQYYPDSITSDDLKNICQGKITLTKTKLLPYYNDNIIKTDYEEVIKTQLNKLMEQQIAKLESEDPNFLKDDEKEIINNSEFPFIKLMTLVYSKDTNEMSDEDQIQWKEYMNQFITQQITFVIINTFYTMNLYQDNIYTTVFQTPYNNDYVWQTYGYNHKSICVAYDFKEITEETVQQIRKIYPILYTDKKYTKADFNQNINNILCASLFKEQSKVNQYDNQWSYLNNHKYTESEYAMLDNLLEPVYTASMNYPKIQLLLKDNYLEINNGELSYNYKQLITNLLETLESDEFLNQIQDKLNEIYDITPETITIDFMKPEAIYLGLDFPEDKIDSFKEIIENENVRLFKIKKSDDKLFKALI